MVGGTQETVAVLPAAVGVLAAVVGAVLAVLDELLEELLEAPITDALEPDTEFAELLDELWASAPVCGMEVRAVED